MENFVFTTGNDKSMIEGGDPHVVYFRNGDASCTYITNAKAYFFTISIFGELKTYRFDDWSGVAKFVRNDFYFNDEMVEELRRKIYVWNGEIVDA